jgi:ubiquinone/menaquinone biosynthesis C-methylase UbiE
MRTEKGSAQNQFKLLNVGGGTKQIPLEPPWCNVPVEHLLLDIAAGPGVDYIWDARDLDRFTEDSFDVIYCSHNLEHFSVKDYPQVLKGFFHVLRPGGAVDIRVPNIQGAMEEMVRRGVELDDTAYVSAAGPISYHDMLYGYGEYVKNGNQYMQHYVGFSPRTLERALVAQGFKLLKTEFTPFNIVCLAQKPAE